MRRFSPHDVRTRLFLVVTASLALGLIAATVGFNVLLVKTSERDANSLLQQRVVSERSLVQVRRGRLLLTEHFDDRLADSRVWIFGRFRVIEAPSSRPETARAASMLNHGPSRFTSLAHSD